MALVLALALLLDRLFAEPKIAHPLVAFGRCANALERKLNPAGQNQRAAKLRGALAWLLLVCPLPLVYFVYLTDYVPWYLEAVFVYLAVGNSSLKQHAMQVYQPLSKGDMTAARHYCSYLVSRQTEQLDEQQISRAVTESVLENGHDAVIASLFWYCIGGVPLVLAHRFANTLDAMWGYRTDRFQNFGWFAAKADDYLGWPSAKVTSLCYAIQGANPLTCLVNGYRQGRNYKSLNGGWTMASGASALYIKLGGSANYFGQVSKSVTLGMGNAVRAADIARSTGLVNRASWLFVAAIGLIEFTVN